jgi:hypothetical protein
LSKQLTKKSALQDDTDEEEDAEMADEENPGTEAEPDPGDPWITVGPSKKKNKPEKKKKSAKIEINPSDFILMNAKAVSGSQLPDEVRDSAIQDDVR